MRKKNKRNFKYRSGKIDNQLDEFLCDSYMNGTLNITQEAKRLRVSRTSVYRHLHKAGLIKQEVKKKGFWGKIKEYFGFGVFDNMPTLTEKDKTK